MTLLRFYTPISQKTFDIEGIHSAFDLSKIKRKIITKKYQTNLCFGVSYAAWQLYSEMDIYIGCNCMLKNRTESNI